VNAVGLEELALEVVPQLEGDLLLGRELDERHRRDFVVDSVCHTDDATQLVVQIAVSDESRKKEEGKIRRRAISR